MSPSVAPLYFCNRQLDELAEDNEPLVQITSTGFQSHRGRLYRPRPSHCSRARGRNRFPLQRQGRSTRKLCLSSQTVRDQVTDVQVAEREVHAGLITDLQLSLDRTWFTTSSKDKTAKVGNGARITLSQSPLLNALFLQALDVQSLRILKTYTTETPLNSAAILPHKPYVQYLGASDVILHGR